MYPDFDPEIVGADLLIFRELVEFLDLDAAPDTAKLSADSWDWHSRRPARLRRARERGRWRD
ncbi:hypothetical protein [Nocardia sp. NPDC046763]|uniref:hypothetical protein n=1 Tax=Nocardia sp. NPDC046763 TaxID=3155256 RepID=UPI0033F7A5D9